MYYVNSINMLEGKHLYKADVNYRMSHLSISI